MADRLSWLQKRRARHVLAFGEHSLFAGRLGPADGSWGLVEVSQRRLPSDLLSFSPVEPNVQSVSDLARLVGEVLEEVSCQGGKIAVILPDLALRAFALPVEGRVRPQEMLARVAARLPFPRSEAIIDTWSGSHRWALIAAVRRAVLRQYEQALEAIGCRAAWVDGASLIKIPQWTRDASEDRENGSAPPMRVHVQLYPQHYSLAVFRQGDLTDFRVKLGSPEDRDRLLDELVRLPTVSGGGEYREISVQGEGAARLVESLEDGSPVGGRAKLGENGHQAHLAALMVSMIQRI